MMDLREMIARAIHGNCDRELDASWGDWLPEADAVLYALRQAALTDTFVQPVPDRCDRITWRGAYYHLPIAQAAVPEGWQLVPIEPTISMCMAADKARITVDDPHIESAIYRAMLAAVPKHGEQE